MSDDNLNKCDTCKHDFATCDSRKVVWGIDRNPSARGADADKVLECDAYSLKDPPPVQSFQSPDAPMCPKCKKPMAPAHNVGPCNADPVWKCYACHTWLHRGIEDRREKSESRAGIPPFELRGSANH